ncbi:N-acyl amino acid synthase, PEP-CTERM/exosortase system-associated [Nitrosomonas sp. PY1]|uniref:PEP-CTERM/exosortase system-associated acyltransferase n=1 Tax=Nitrosomonas sp. PY1 TaxID=1803906 RepID=UPI001FC7F36F|nr:PEP-CTERM/exosortase system-associated acyltransferase [Nitrosomonas sp. PY1]GKS68726.1 N-acyl amino acid synthase, PEP-CTERM/exosortase system-associated [Nitrosomonas sp. PY1]
MNDSYSGFRSFFEIVVADTPELLEAVYRIRYQVLCVQNSFPDMNASDYPDQLEKDEYDDHSCHALLRFKSTGQYIGAVRLILPDPNDSEKLLPVEVNTHVDSKLCDLKNIHRADMAEISRAVILSQFDRRKGERRKSRDGESRRSDDSKSNGNVIRSDKDRRASDRRSTPHLSLLLMACVMRLSVKHNIKYWISAMEPALNRLLRFYGLNFHCAGPTVNYHGIRRPYCIKVEEVLSRMYKENYESWEVLTECGKYNLSF